MSHIFYFLPFYQHKFFSQWVFCPWEFLKYISLLKHLQSQGGIKMSGRNSQKDLDKLFRRLIASRSHKDAIKNTWVFVSFAKYELLELLIFTFTYWALQLGLLVNLLIKYWILQRSTSRACNQQLLIL